MQFRYPKTQSLDLRKTFSLGHGSFDLQTGKKIFRKKKKKKLFKEALVQIFQPIQILNWSIFQQSSKYMSLMDNLLY